MVDCVQKYMPLASSEKPFSPTVGGLPNAPPGIRVEPCQTSPKAIEAVCAHSISSDLREVPLLREFDVKVENATPQPRSEQNMFNISAPLQ